MKKEKDLSFAVAIFLYLFNNRNKVSNNALSLSVNKIRNASNKSISEYYVHLKTYIVTFLKKNGYLHVPVCIINSQKMYHFIQTWTINGYPIFYFHTENIMYIDTTNNDVLKLLYRQKAIGDFYNNMTSGIINHVRQDIFDCMYICICYIYIIIIYTHITIKLQRETIKNQNMK